MEKTAVLGVDIGGVIIDRVNDGTDTSFFSENYLATTRVPGVFAALRYLVERKFKENVFLVSKCGQRVQNRTLEWLDYHEFFQQTGIARERAVFCRERSEKAGICERLGITHFVDDRLEILGSLKTVGTLYLFKPLPREILKFSQFLPMVQRVDHWSEIVKREIPMHGAHIGPIS